MEPKGVRRASGGFKTQLSAVRKAGANNTPCVLGEHGQDEGEAVAVDAVGHPQRRALALQADSAIRSLTHHMANTQQRRQTSCRGRMLKHAGKPQEKYEKRDMEYALRFILCHFIVRQLVPACVISATTLPTSEPACSPCMPRGLAREGGGPWRSTQGRASPSLFRVSGVQGLNTLA